MLEISGDVCALIQVRISIVKKILVSASQRKY